MSKVFNTTTSLKSELDNYRSDSKTIAFVPTMGGLHAGHLSLVDIAKENADIVVVSIFVNPTQFGKNEDFDKYPNTFENDKQLLDEKAVEIIFAPSKDDIYPQGTDSDINLGEIANILCGASRPGHFEGVVQVVKRLFEIVKPDIAVFGEKDFQQLLIIKQMSSQYFPDIEIISHPIVREADGLAMSTRNLYLSTDERRFASKLYQVLLNAKQNYLNNADIQTIKNKATTTLDEAFSLDYFEILDANTLMEITTNTDKIAILCAVFLGSTRLIDNIIFNKG